MKRYLILFSLFLASFSPFVSAASEDSNAARPRESVEDAVMGDVLLQAMSLMGIAYHFGGTNPNTGFDCSGFIRYIFQRSIGVSLPRTAAEQARVGRSVERSELKAGDILFFNTRGFANSHNGLYLGNGRFVHAPRTGKNIEIANLSHSYWASRYNGARRVTRSNVHAGNVREEVLTKKTAKVEKVAEVASVDVPTENSTPRRSLRNVEDPMTNLAISANDISVTNSSSNVISNSAFVGTAAGVLASGAAVALFSDNARKAQNSERRSTLKTKKNQEKQEDIRSSQEKRPELKARDKGSKKSKNDKKSKLESRNKESNKETKATKSGKSKKASAEKSSKSNSSSNKQTKKQKLTAGKRKS